MQSIFFRIFNCNPFLRRKRRRLFGLLKQPIQSAKAWAGKARKEVHPTPNIPDTWMDATMRTTNYTKIEATTNTAITSSHIEFKIWNLGLKLWNSKCLTTSFKQNLLHLIRLIQIRFLGFFLRFWSRKLKVEHGRPKIWVRNRIFVGLVLKFICSTVLGHKLRADAILTFF